MARFEQEKETYQYRDYVTTSLQLIPQQKYIPIKYSEYIGRVTPDERNGDEIAEDVITKAGLTYECI